MRDIHRETVAESYSFVCLACGHGWEQAYRIEHYVQPDGQPYVLYYADDQQVPSPLSRPTCVNCEGHRIRVLRAGAVDAAAKARGEPAGRPGAAARPGAAEPSAAEADAHPADQPRISQPPAPSA